MITPLAITLYILQMLFGFALNFIDPVVTQANLEDYTANVEAVARVLAAVLIVLVVSILGFLAQRPAVSGCSEASGALSRSSRSSGRSTRQ